MLGVGKHQTVKMQVHVVAILSTMLLLLPINMLMHFLVVANLPTMLLQLYASIAIVLKPRLHLSCIN